jgi:hypothetical protein
VYGDSTPFPHEGNFIETIRHAVDCGVALLAAQHAIHRAVARAGDVDRAREVERARLDSMGSTVKRALAGEMATTSDRVLRTGARILDSSRQAIEAELVALEAASGTELARLRTQMMEARAAAKRALETFLVLHDLPGTEIGLRLVAEEEKYGAEVHVATPFGVEAAFELQIPEAHEWGRHRRVGDLAPGTEVHLAQESGLIWKKVAVQPVKLDRYFVSAFRVGAVRSAITLRRQPASGSGYKLDFDATGERPRVLLAHIGEDGGETPEPVLELSGEDAMHVLRLWQRVLDSTDDLTRRRTRMVRGTYDEHAIGELDEPKLVVDRLVGVLAPMVREIARRSGAPGELVLRRDLRAGRRDEIYITTAELHERVMTLPPLLRDVFAPFELDKPRSPRAPAPSLPSYSELHDDDLVEVATKDVSVVAAPN